MRILADRHHSDLLYALQRLFEDRLGYELFIPVGHDSPSRQGNWWSEGYWKFGEVWGDDRLARQFLNTDAQYREVEPGLFLTFDPCHPERPLYGVTLERARTQEWDIVLATVQENQQGFHRFAKEVGAQYLYQVGNARQEVDWDLDPLVLNAANAPMQGRGVHICQEFDHQTTFRYRKPKNMNRIASFVNLLACIPGSWAPFEELKNLLGAPYTFRSFGHECPDGFLKPVAALAEEMARSAWAYHDKPTGDGFGHVIFNWAAVGRPLIGHARFYEGQKAEAFWQDGVTCIDLDKHSIEEAAQIIADTTPEQHRRMCLAIRAILERIYHPEADAIAVSEALGRR